MLIRSQDRKWLVPLNRPICAFGRHVTYYDEAEGTNGYPLGTYASESRCLEVLDEIQKMFTRYQQIQSALGPSFMFDDPKVYQMPEK